jgi:hypothetical protein
MYITKINGSIGARWQVGEVAAINGQRHSKTPTVPAIKKKATIIITIFTAYM